MPFFVQPITNLSIDNDNPRKEMLLQKSRTTKLKSRNWLRMQNMLEKELNCYEAKQATKHVLLYQFCCESGQLQSLGFFH